ncbi:MAG: AI-2E family transporter [Bacteroidia bacterium]|nr:AI-2E family transporter [Bacteroidia bacterium]
MSNSYKYFLITVGVILLLALLWYIQTVVAYILISALLSLLGKPMVRLLQRMKIGRLRIPVSLSAFITLLLLLAFFFFFFWFFIPLVVHQGSELSTIDVHQVLNSLQEPIHKMQNLFSKFIVKGKEDFSLEQYLVTRLESVLNVSLLTNFINNLVNFIGNIFFAVFAISFITFFFLMEENMFLEGILMFVPDKYEERVKSVIFSIEELLIKYITRMGLRIIGVLILTTGGLILAGLKTDTSLVIGLFNAIINIVPYIGPLIGIAFGLIVGLAANVHMGFTPDTGHLVIYMLLVFASVQIIDQLLSPFIMSGSVKAHPLEIFLVTIIAGSISGIGGMILAVPVYTILRVIAKEFLSKFKTVRKITRNI